MTSRLRSSLLLPATLAIAAALLTACGSDPGGGGMGAVRLEVTVQDWTGWSREQPDPEVATHELAEGESFTVAVVGAEELVVTLARVGDGEVELATSEPMSGEGEGGGVDLNDPRTDFTLERGGAVVFSTPTLDGGTTVSVVER